MTMQPGQAVYDSCSQRTLWHKGATSGEFQEVIDIRTDCDQAADVLRLELKSVRKALPLTDL